ncbi:hypothetical protein HPB48_005583 [Haemaphysalis longicornis]|uniref:Elongation of very long chain fatty acids protein n=1 Tax=Haemaphysalis longicornis TaxID=44386 RepID=A0A9J6GHC3_HAELO|nr:hypothetical protein HPB48_005583 [Haemaphysalis longicornis]
MALSLSPTTLLEELHSISDPRTRDYPVVLNPFFVFPMLVAYLYFVKVGGPRWMKNKEPFQIINIIRIYNITMVFVSCVSLVVLLIPTYLPGGSYSLWCQGITGYSPEDHLKYYKHAWILIAWRYADLLDTVFFVLRKKFNQVTHLHVIHHTIVVVNIWFYARFAPEGQPALGLALNIFVHIVMYTYYFLASFGPRMHKYLWWKKYLTTLQIVQFLIIIVHMSIPLFVDCGFPRHVVYIGNVQTFLILCLFINFYVKAYTNRHQRPTTAKGATHIGKKNSGAPLKNGKVE